MKSDNKISVVVFGPLSEGDEQLKTIKRNIHEKKYGHETYECVTYEGKSRVLYWSNIYGHFIRMAKY